MMVVAVPMVKPPPSIKRPSRKPANQPVGPLEITPLKVTSLPVPATLVRTVIAWLSVMLPEMLSESTARAEVGETGWLTVIGPA